MLNLLFAILSSTGIFITFKYLEKFKIDILLAIIVNYLTASLCGYFMSNTTFNFNLILKQDWFNISILIGVLFIIVFFTIGRSIQKAGISVTTLASNTDCCLASLIYSSFRYV